MAATLVLMSPAKAAFAEKITKTDEGKVEVKSKMPNLLKVLTLIASAPLTVAASITGGLCMLCNWASGGEQNQHLAAQLFTGGETHFKAGGEFLPKDLLKHAGTDPVLLRSQLGAQGIQRLANAAIKITNEDVEVERSSKFTQLELAAFQGKEVSAAFYAEHFCGNKALAKELRLYKPEPQDLVKSGNIKELKKMANDKIPVAKETVKKLLEKSVVKGERLGGLQELSKKDLIELSPEDYAHLILGKDSVAFCLAEHKKEGTPNLTVKLDTTDASFFERNIMQTDSLIESLRFIQSDMPKADKMRILKNNPETLVDVPSKFLKKVGVNNIPDALLSPEDKLRKQIIQDKTLSQSSANVRLTPEEYLFLVEGQSKEAYELYLHKQNKGGKEAPPIEKKEKEFSANLLGPKEEFTQITPKLQEMANYLVGDVKRKFIEAWGNSESVKDLCEKVTDWTALLMNRRNTLPEGQQKTKIDNFLISNVAKSSIKLTEKQFKELFLVE